MADITLDNLFEQARQLNHIERLRLMERLAASLQADLSRPTDWQAALRETYGILADDPIERPEQPALEERDPLI
jgi:hypothetical protein